MSTVDIKVPADEAKLAYLAGIIDGEGWIGISSTGDYYDTTYHSIFLRVANTEKSVMDWLFDNFGGKVNKRCREDRDNWKDLYEWKLSSGNAAEILKAVKPYLVIKKEQADVALECRETKDPNYQGGLPDKVVEKRKRLKDKMQELNQNGTGGADG